MYSIMAAKGTFWAKTTEKIKPIALAIVELCKSAGNQSVSRKFREIIFFNPVATF